MQHISCDCRRYGQILNKNVVQDTETAALLVACACARLEHCKRLSEKRYIYQFLAEAATLFPEVFSLVSSLLDPNMAQTISRPQDRGTVAACHVIVQALLSAQLQAAVSPTLIQDLGFVRFPAASNVHGFARCNLVTWHCMPTPVRGAYAFVLLSPAMAHCGFVPSP